MDIYRLTLNGLGESGDTLKYRLHSQSALLCSI